MEIRRVEYKNIYGSLSDKLTFSQGENFLVGINGCGKSTVLNLIRWVLGPSLPDLCTNQHDLIKIDVRHKKYMYSIQSRIEGNQHELKVVTKDKSRNFEPIVTQLSIQPRHIQGLSQKYIKDQYEHCTPEPHEIETWSFLLEELSTPVFIGLKRSVKNYLFEQNFNRKIKYPRINEKTTPQLTAITLMRDAFNTSRHKLVEINDELNRSVLELSFSGVLSSKLGVTQPSLQRTAKKIEQLKNRFESTINEGPYSKALSAKGVRTAVVKYLENLSSLLSGGKKEDDVWIMLNQHNFERASKMFDLFEKHELKISEAQQEITDFSRTVNKFIGDSGKSIHFNENTGAPYFKSTAFSERLRLSELSSGETQVIILLSYFAFIAMRGIPIIIDEPELSLHVQWQTYFVDAIKEVMPEKCQTIMATHSPEICGAEDVNVQSISVRMAK